MTELFPDQAQSIEHLRESMRRHRAVLLQGETGCHAKGTKILMYDGTLKNVEDVKKNDLIMGDNSTQRRVLGTIWGHEDLYTITPRNGESFVVNENHILCLMRTNTQNPRMKNDPAYMSRCKPKGHIVNIRVKDYFLKSLRFKHLYKLWRTHVNFINNDFSLPLSPYFLGAWLGDGTSKNTSITTMDKEVADCVFEEARRHKNLYVRTETKPNNKASTHHITTGIKGGNTRVIKNPVLQALQFYNLIGNKHIPFDYKTCSIKERRNILAGLIDTDGSLSSGVFDYISKSEMLANDVVFLARSIGLCASKNKCRKTDQNGTSGIYYRICISGDLSTIPTRIKRKQAAPRVQKKNCCVTGFSISKAGIGEFYGFQLDGNNLYLTSDFIVHHNSGKSVMAAYMINGCRQKSVATAFVVPRRDLLHQMSRTFSDFEIPHSFVAAGKPFNPYALTHICTVGTLINRKEKIKPKIVFLDECHFGAGQLEEIITYYKSQGFWVIGLSATPEKPNGQGLDAYYDDMVCGPTIRQLIEMKRLSDYRLFAPSRPDLSQIKTVAGDYAKGQLADLMENESVLIGDAVKHYISHAEGKLNVTFCTSIKHSQLMAEAFNRAGVPSVHMDGETPDDERRGIARAFARRELQNICSVDLLCFGYDLASASGDKKAVIESISDCRPTKSRPLQRQKNGRALRYKDYPAIILDHGGNAMVHGMPCEDIEWTLKGEDKKGRGGERAVAVRQCAGGWRDGPMEGPEMPPCYFTHAPSNRCPNCGAYYEVASREVEERDGELEEIDKDRVRRQLRMEQGMCKTLEELVAYGIKTGKKNPEGWAKHVFNARSR